MAKRIDPMNIALIPARGGSKRIPNKNIRPFCGKPMIAWSIGAALTSGLFDRVIVSTDSEEIAQIALSYGAEVPFIRPTELSTDYCGTIPVIAHAINEIRSTGASVNRVCCIYATAPFISKDDLIAANSKLDLPGVRFSFPVARFQSPIQRAIRIDVSGLASMFEPESFHQRSQDLEPAYHDVGQFYWGLADAWNDDAVVFSKISAPIVIPSYRAQDIDTEDDWIRAELMFLAIRDTESHYALR
jgi:pseudaminic acid cytidylyltransferase